MLCDVLLFQSAIACWNEMLHVKLRRMPGFKLRGWISDHNESSSLPWRRTAEAEVR